MKLSVIIPTCNERQYLHKTINTVINHAVGKHRLEIIVVDCGSMDGTTLAIKHKSVVVVENPSLKGKKWASLNLGGRLAQGDVLLFLDADTILPPGYDLAINDALEDKEIVGGAFEFSFDKSSPLLRVITILNRIRYRIRNRYYGDQGIFVRKSVYDKMEGWPERRLLEGAYFCKELADYGKLKLLPLAVKTSSRRFQHYGVHRMLIYDLKIWFYDILGKDVEKYGDDYWSNSQQINTRSSNSSYQITPKPDGVV